MSGYYDDYVCLNNKSEAFKAGYRSLLNHERRTGRCNVSPSITELAEWPEHQQKDYRAGFNAAKKGS